MAAKHLASANLTANVLTEIGSVPTDKEWSFTIEFCNRNDYDVKIRFAVSTSTSPDPGNYYLYNTVLPANGNIKRSGHTAQASRKIMAWAESNNVSVNIHGYED